MTGDGWPIESLSYLLDGIEAGKSPDLPDSPAGFGEWGVLKVSAVHHSGFRAEENKRVETPSIVDPRYQVNSGDLLISRANTPELVGLACIVPELSARLLLSDKTLRLKVNPARALAEYVNACLASPGVRRQIVNAASGSSRSMQNIGQKAIERLRLPVPPIEEQRRIVDVIYSVAELERGIETSIAKTRLVRKEVARRVLLGGNRPLRKIKDVGTVSSGNTPSRARRDFWEGGDVPWVRTGEIDFNVITETGEHVTRKAVREAGLRVYPQGTVLLAMYGDGATRGRVGSLGVEATINQAAAAIVCDPLQVDHRYLYYFLETQYTEIRNIGQGSNRSNLNGALVGAIEIPLPSVEEQRELVISLEAFDGKVQADRAELAKLRELKRGLVDDLLSGRVAVPAVAA
ncbi:restriction endonuclease subunit S [Streptomyces sp. NPDC017936]|uniref:restriction endonuclease subunit S n=1 Tax=Streptomyces sp. NPDC017936 TaxID=3365016 RepID=UPI0037B15872